VPIETAHDGHMPASKAGQQALVSKAEALRRLKHRCTA